jgi:hypothetical protein
MSTAQKIDKYSLYLDSVQAPEFEVAFFEKVFKKEFSIEAVSLREDFAGSAAVCYEWVKSKKFRWAYAVDYDLEPLEWGKDYFGEHKNVTMLNQDVRSPSPIKTDLISAQNSSFCIFKTRKELLEYFQFAYNNLKDKGLFILDLMGGPATQQDEYLEKKKKSSFTYEWQQLSYDPVNNRAQFAINFKLKNGKTIAKAFKYDWRMWTLPELRELLEEAGFVAVDTYFECTDSKTQKGNGVFRITKKSTAHESWIAYIVAKKNVV